MSYHYFKNKMVFIPITKELTFPCMEDDFTFLINETDYIVTTETADIQGINVNLSDRYASEEEVRLYNLYLKLRQI